MRVNELCEVAKKHSSDPVEQRNYIQGYVGNPLSEFNTMSGEQKKDLILTCYEELNILGTNEDHTGSCCQTGQHRSTSTAPKTVSTVTPKTTPKTAKKRSKK